MYCANCGNPMDPNAVVCVKCGVKAGYGYQYCQNCGNPTVPGATICTTCGAMLSGYVQSQAKSKLAAGLFGIFLGSFGVHNFYLGYTGKAVAQLLITVLTCGFGAVVSSIWGLVEGILILTGSIAVDGRGMPLRD